MDSNTWGVILLVLLLFTPFWVIGHGIVGAMTGGNWFIFTPKDIYENTDTNWFGTILLYILCWIICPLYPLVSFIHWITHVGRKGSDEDN